MITKERRAELREMNDVHDVTKEGMFKIKTPEFIELLDDLNKAEAEVDRLDQDAECLREQGDHKELDLENDINQRDVEIERLREVLEQIARPAPGEKQTSYTNILKGIARQALEIKS